MQVKQNKFICKSDTVKQVKIAVSKALGVEVISVKRVIQGEISYAFKVMTRRGVVLAKVLKFKGWPDVPALIKVGKLLSKHQIPHPMVLYFAKHKAYFPHGLLIQKYIEGEDCHKAILSGKISFVRYHYLLGKLLRKLHGIRLKRFGRLSKPLAKGTTYYDIRLKHLIKHLDEFNGTALLPSGLRNELLVRVGPGLKLVSEICSPVLTHGDATPDNCILTPQGELALIDWDNSKASAWLEDFTWLTYCGSHMTSLGSLEKRSKIIWREFFRGYGRAGITKEDIKEIEYSLHLLKAVSHLGYHYFAQRNERAFKQTLAKLKRLLKK